MWFTHLLRCLCELPGRRERGLHHRSVLEHLVVGSVCTRSNRCARCRAACGYSNGGSIRHASAYIAASADGYSTAAAHSDPYSDAHRHTHRNPNTSATTDQAGKLWHYSEGSKFIRSAVRELVTTILPPALLALFLNVFVAEAALVEEGPSMQPNLYIGYRVMTEKVSHHFHLARRDDIVVAESDDRPISRGCDRIGVHSAW